MSNKLKELEQAHIESKDDKILEQIKNIKEELNNILHKQIEVKLKYLGQNYYENGPKAKKILAWKLRKQLTDRTVTKIKNPLTKTYCHKPEDMEESFALYYKELYTQPQIMDSSLVKGFLGSLDLPSIGEEQNKMLTQEVTKAELDKAISRLKTKCQEEMDSLQNGLSGIGTFCRQWC